jgi:hypothetical protein
MNPASYLGPNLLVFIWATSLNTRNESSAFTEYACGRKLCDCVEHVEWNCAPLTEMQNEVNLSTGFHCAHLLKTKSETVRFS